MLDRRFARTIIFASSPDVGIGALPGSEKSSKWLWVLGTVAVGAIGITWWQAQKAAEEAAKDPDNRPTHKIARIADRLAQKDPEWAAQQDPTAYKQGWNLADIANDATDWITEQTLKGEKVVIHGRDGDTFYQLLKRRGKADMSKVSYVISSSPLTISSPYSQEIKEVEEAAKGDGYGKASHKGGYDPSFMAQMDPAYRAYLHRVVPRGAIHVDTGYVGTIPDWMDKHMRGGMTGDKPFVKDIKLIGFSPRDNAMKDLPRQLQLPRHTRDALVDSVSTFENTPKRLARVSDESIENSKNPKYAKPAWGKNRAQYAKDAPGFWSFLQAIEDKYKGDTSRKSRLEEKAKEKQIDKVSKSTSAAQAKKNAAQAATAILNNDSATIAFWKTNLSKKEKEIVEDLLISHYDTNFHAEMIERVLSGASVDQVALNSAKKTLAESKQTLANYPKGTSSADYWGTIVATHEKTVRKIEASIAAPKVPQGPQPQGMAPAPASFQFSEDAGVYGAGANYNKTKAEKVASIKEKIAAKKQSPIYLAQQASAAKAVKAILDGDAIETAKWKAMLTPTEKGMVHDMLEDHYDKVITTGGLREMFDAAGKNEAPLYSLAKHDLEQAHDMRARVLQGKAPKIDLPFWDEKIKKYKGEVESLAPATKVVDHSKHSLLTKNWLEAQRVKISGLLSEGNQNKINDYWYYVGTLGDNDKALIAAAYKDEQKKLDMKQLVTPTPASKAFDQSFAAKAPIIPASKAWIDQQKSTISKLVGSGNEAKIHEYKMWATTLHPNDQMEIYNAFEAAYEADKKFGYE